MKLVSKIALVLFILFLAGTMPSLEPSRRMVAEAAAIDFENGVYVVSAYGVTDFGEGGMKGRLCVSSGATPQEAVDNFVFTEGKDLFLKQCKLLLIGPGAAAHMEELLDFFSSTRDLNYFARVALTQGTAAQLLDFGEDGASIDDLYYLTEKQKKDEETYENRMVDLLKQGLRTPSAFMLPVLSDGVVSGVSAFYSGRAAAFLSSEQYRLAELLLGLSSAQQLVLNGENAEITRCEQALSVRYGDGALQTESSLRLVFSGTDAQRAALEQQLGQIGKTLAEVGALPVDLTFKMTDYSNWKALRDRGQTPEVTYRLQVSYKSEGDPTAE